MQVDISLKLLKAGKHVLQGTFNIIYISSKDFRHFHNLGSLPIILGIFKKKIQTALYIDVTWSLVLLWLEE